jgi:hypothetical protein
MSSVLTTQSTVGCGHSGTVATEGAARLTVAGHAVLTRQGVNGKQVRGCQTVPATNPNGTPKDAPCTAVAGVDRTEAARLRVGGAPALVDPLGGATNGLKDSQSTTTLQASVVQTWLKAV